MAKNSEVYKTAQERAEAFIDHCEHCWKTDCSVSETIDCFAHWLDLEAEEEKNPKTIEDIVNDMKIKSMTGASLGGYEFTEYIERIEAAHNRVAKKCMEVKK